MTLKELYESKYSHIEFIGLWEYDENGYVKDVYPDYADEILETHGNMIVKDHTISQGVLIVELKEV